VLSLPPLRVANGTGGVQPLRLQTLNPLGPREPPLLRTSTEASLAISEASESTEATEATEASNDSDETDANSIGYT
jgi:hypothetical protein